MNAAAFSAFAGIERRIYAHVTVLRFLCGSRRTLEIKFDIGLFLFRRNSASRISTQTTMKNFIIALAIAVVTIAGTVAVTHYAADSAQVVTYPPEN